MKRRTLILFLFLTGCYTSPVGMFYQRTEYKIDRVGNLFISTSPDLKNIDVLRTDSSVEVVQDWLVQNKGEKNATINLNLGTALVGADSKPLICKSHTSDQKEVSLGKDEKSLISCTLVLRKTGAEKNDLWIEFSIQSSEGRITSRKLVRAEDFK